MSTKISMTDAAYSCMEKRKREIEFTKLWDDVAKAMDIPPFKEISINEVMDKRQVKDCVDVLYVVGRADTVEAVDDEHGLGGGLAVDTY